MDLEQRLIESPFDSYTVDWDSFNCAMLLLLLLLLLLFYSYTNMVQRTENKHKN